MREYMDMSIDIWDLSRAATPYSLAIFNDLLNWIDQ
jgi:hypothetical protein